MKKIILPLIVSALLLVGCERGEPVSSSSEDGGTSLSTTSELAEWIDYINSDEAKINLDYEGRDFYKDGIGEMELRMCIDGDTAHFNPVITTTSSEPVKARFYGIDTPESTGKVQKWGKEASDFTKEKLTLAAEQGTIVVSSPFLNYREPEHDSTGERYVSLVWVNTEKEHAPAEELTLLNLWIVQEGLSWVKNVTDEEFSIYENVFYAAEIQARAYKLNLFSNETPPSWPDDEYVVTSLLDLKHDVIGTLTDENYEPVYDNVRVRIQGAVAGYANNILYLEDYFDEEISGTPGGEYAGINIFVGMSKIPDKYTVPNTYLEICGLATYSENFGYQITDAEGRFPTGRPYADTDTVIIYTAEENVEHQIEAFDYTISELNDVTTQETFESLFCLVSVSEVLTVRDAYVASSNEITLYFEGCEFQAYVTFIYRGDPSRPNYQWGSEEDWIGKRLQVQGIYTFHKTTSGNINYQINPRNNADIVWVDAPSV